MNGLHFVEAVKVTVNELLNEVRARLLVDMIVKLYVFGIATLIGNLEDVDTLFRYCNNSRVPEKSESGISN